MFDWLGRCLWAFLDPIMEEVWSALQHNRDVADRAYVNTRLHGLLLRIDATTPTVGFEYSSDPESKYQKRFEYLQPHWKARAEFRKRVQEVLVEWERRS